MSDGPRKLDYHVPERRESIGALVGLQILDFMALSFIAVVIVAAITFAVIGLSGGFADEQSWDTGDWVIRPLLAIAIVVAIIAALLWLRTRRTPRR